VEMPRWGTVISGFVPLSAVVALVDPLLTVLDHFAPVGGRGPKTTELTSLSSNQAFTFTSSTWILSHKNSKTVQNSIYSTLKCGWRTLAFPLAFPLAFSASFGNLRRGNALD